MDLITNSKTTNHRSVLTYLIKWADECLLCTSFFDKKGLEHLLPALTSGTAAGEKKVTIYSNGEDKYTKPSVISKLKRTTGIDHILIKIKSRRLHSKIYLFEKDREFSVIVGSANLTDNGLVNNEELSVLMTGAMGSAEHAKYRSYFDELSTMQGRR